MTQCLWTTVGTPTEMPSIPRALADVTAKRRQRRSQRRVRHLNHASIAAPAQPPFDSDDDDDDDEPPKWMVVPTRTRSRDLPLPSRIHLHLTTIFCLLSLGHASMSKIWVITRPGHHEAWHAFRDNLAYRTANTNIMVRVFCVVGPPLPLTQSESPCRGVSVRSCAHIDRGVLDDDRARPESAPVHGRPALHLRSLGLRHGLDRDRLWLVPPLRIERSRGNVVPCTSASVSLTHKLIFSSPETGEIACTALVDAIHDWLAVVLVSRVRFDCYHRCVFMCIVLDSVTTVLMIT